MKLNLKYLKEFSDFITFQRVDPIPSGEIINKERTDRGVHNSLIRGDKLFKGHSFDLIYSSRNKKEDKGNITLYQHYFSGMVTSSYNINDEKTSNTWVSQGHTPKWLANKLNLVGEYLTGIDPQKVKQNQLPLMKFSLESTGELFRQEGNPNLNIWTGCYTLKYTNVTEGFDMKQHKDNIDELKKLSEHWKKIRGTLKEMSVKDIAKICCNTGENLYSHHILQLINPDLRDLI